MAPLATRWIERLLSRQKPPLTVTQYLALRAIARQEVSVGELAEKAGVSDAAVSQLLGGLAHAGLLERQVGETDRRRVSLVLLPAGKRAYESAEGLLKKRLGSLLEGLPPPEVDALSRLLPQVEAALSGAPPPRRPHLPPGPRPPRGPRGGRR